MARWRVILVAAVAVTISHVVESCNVRELAKIIGSRFRQEAMSSCGGLGEKCSFDRDCCVGMECKMSVNNMGVDNYCEERVINTGREENTPLVESGELPNQQFSEEDGAWMLASKSDTSDMGGSPSDTLDKIDDLQEIRRYKLIKENEELKKLFTEKDEKELEQLRTLKEDAEMDELRRLKELKLKRKLDLLREIEELRGLKAQHNLIKFDDFKNQTVTAVNETSVDWKGENATVGFENEKVSKDGNLNTTVIESDHSTQHVEIDELESSTTTYKQGIHHKRKHHQGKHKKKSHEH